MSARALLSHDIIRPKAGIKYLYRNPPIIALHGLFGQKSNLRTVANAESVSQYRACYLLDLRNHGESFHSHDMHFPSLVEDVIHFMNHMSIPKAIWLGHSYGGKVAYLAGLMYPQFVSSIIALDVAPKAYTSRNELYIKLLKVFQLIPSMTFANRKAIEQYISEQIPEIKPFEAQFLTSTLAQTANGGQQWLCKMNVDVLLEQIENITRFDIEDSDEMQYRGNTYIIRGGESKFVLDDDIPEIRHKFPNLKLMTVDGASHYLHLDKTVDTIQCVASAINEVNPM